MKDVLIVDDDEINNFLLDQILDKISFIDTRQFELNGLFALQYLENCERTNQFPDMIFVDLKMPVVDGLEFIRQYEKCFWARHPDTRVYILSSSVSLKDKRDALSYKSVRDYIVKPLTSQTLSSITGCNGSK